MTLKQKLTNTFLKLSFIDTYREGEYCADLFLQEMIRILELKREDLEGEFNNAQNGTNDQLIKGTQLKFLKDYIREIKTELNDRH